MIHFFFKPGFHAGRGILLVFAALCLLGWRSAAILAIGLAALLSLRWLLREERKPDQGGDLYEPE